MSDCSFTAQSKQKTTAVVFTAAGAGESVNGRVQVSGASSSHPHGVVEGLRCPLAEVELVCDFPLLFASFGSGALLLGLHLLLLGLASLCRCRLAREVSRLNSRSSLGEVDLWETWPLQKQACYVFTEASVSSSSASSSSAPTASARHRLKKKKKCIISLSRH